MLKEKIKIGVRDKRKSHFSFAPERKFQALLKNARRITIMGLGIYPYGSGISTALFFAKQGARVLVTDLKSKKELQPQIKKLQKYKNVSFVLGRHRKQDFKNTDLVFQNPLVPDYSPYIKLARKNKIPVINDWSIFLSLCDNFLIGITGTKGKSTTSSLIYEFLKTGNQSAILCGNIGDSPLKYFLSEGLSLERDCPPDVVVAELSSWLLRGFKPIKKSPHIAVISNLLVEHQDKYKSIKAYYRDKENILKYQDKDDYLILNKDNKELRKYKTKAKAQVYWFSKKPFNYGNGVYKDGDSICFQNNKYKKTICSVDDIKIKGEHNLENALAAVLAALLYGVNKKAITNVLKTFTGIPHRLEFIRQVNGVHYYNDTAATSPDATIAAFQTFQNKKGKIILIGGGHDKNLDYKEYVKGVKKYAKALILFRGTATNKILKDLRVRPSSRPDQGSDPQVFVTIVSSMRQAVEQAQKIAQKGDIVLLSPGAASYGIFKNEFDRGNQFIKLVKKL